MYKLWATIQKDLRILTRDKVGLTLMFAMPVLLVMVITSVQNSTFELVNDNKVPLLLCNKDSGQAAKELQTAIGKVGMFEVVQADKQETDEQIKTRMHAKDALVAIVIPADFSAKINARAKDVAEKALKDFGVRENVDKAADSMQPITLYYHPVLQQSFRQSIQGALQSVLQLVESKEVVRHLYLSINEKPIPDSLENAIVNNQVPIREEPVSRNGSRHLPNASQHNVPAWTIFAMFFVVISLGSAVVREKLNGSFIRLKTLPTSYAVALLSKQLTYICVTLLQAMVIFSLGVWFFPVIGLPALNLPADIGGLLLVTLICGWCATSFAICIGVFAQTQEQANGFGAVSIVILAAIGGLLVPSFAMPDSFKTIIMLSPLHWCLEAYYGLFLEGGKLKDIFLNILPLLAITLLIQLITFGGLKKKKLI